MTASSRITTPNPLFSSIALTALLSAVGATPLMAQDMDDVEIQTQRVADGVYMLMGRGGNMGLSVGDEATFIIDDQFAPLTDKIVAAIAAITDRPVDYVLNTHWHYDHTGGNENFGERGALIMAHDNVHRRMQAGQTMGSGRVIDPAPDVALPVVTFNDSLTLHVNGQTITGVHIPHAHTDGDTMVFFKEANVIHMGDTYFSDRYPFIDRNSGGSIDGVIQAAAQAYALGDAATQIIPGHGTLSTKEDLKAYHDMLTNIRDRVAVMMQEGKSLEEIRAAKPTAEYDDANSSGSVTPDVLLGVIFASLSE